MKKTALALLLLPALLAGCATGKKALVADRGPIALVSVVSNGDVNWKGEDSTDPATAGPVARRALSRDPDMAIMTGAQGLVETAEGIFRGAMAGSGAISLAGKEEVLGSRAYLEARANRYQEAREREGEQAKPEGYRYVDYRDKGFAAALLEETGIGRSMYVEYNFTKFMATGAGKIGNMRAQVDMTVMVLDGRGKSLYKRSYGIGSYDRARVTNGVYSQSELVALLESAIMDAAYEFLDDLGN